MNTKHLIPKNKGFCSKRYLFLWLILIAEVSFAQNKAGDNAPEIKVTDWIQNKPTSISLKNKFVIIDFWATWCAPCLASTPHMNKLAEENMGKSNLVFLAMSDEKKEKILPILSRIPFKAAVVTDTTEQTQNAYKIETIPYCIIIDDKGIIQWTGDPKELTNNIIQRILLRKSVDLATDSKEKIEPGYIKRQYDSLRVTYRGIFDNNSIGEYFNMGPFLSEGLGSNYSRNNTFDLEKIEIGVKLKDIFSTLLSVSSAQISVPAAIDSLYTSFCYKSKTKLKNEDVLNVLLNNTQLTCRKNDSIREIISLEVDDASLLNVSHQQAGSTQESHLSSSEDGRFISMGNFALPYIISALEERFNCPVILKNASSFDKPVDMILETGDFIDLKRSLEIYGITAKKIKQPVVFYTFVRR